VSQSLAHIAVIVRDYDEVIACFTGVLGFTLARIRGWTKPKAGCS
jgi:catechol 2,3-dioxygenase-like lactoylglutathione lyase family enzyme